MGKVTVRMDLKAYCGYLERRVKELEEENILLRRKL